MEDQGAQTPEPSKGAATTAEDVNNQRSVGNTMTTIDSRLKTKTEAAKRAVLAEIRADNALDIEGAKTPREHDPRMLKVALKSIDIAPDEFLRKKKFDFNDAQFWYLKGYAHAHATADEDESAIDSYRQAIGINPFHIESMHNLACVYEAQ